MRTHTTTTTVLKKQETYEEEQQKRHKIVIALATEAEATNIYDMHDAGDEKNKLKKRNSHSFRF